MFIDFGQPNTSVSPGEFAQARAHVESRWSDKAPFPWPLHIRERAPIADTFSAESRLKELAALGGNWDGYGAAALSPTTVGNAKLLVQSILDTVPLPEISPNPNGTISLEWEAERGYAALEIGQTRYSFFLNPSDGTAPSYLAGPVSEVDGASLGQFIAARLFTVYMGSLAIGDYRFAHV
jgi:hypothetical protein